MSSESIDTVKWENTENFLERWPTPFLVFIFSPALCMHIINQCLLRRFLRKLVEAISVGFHNVLNKLTLDKVTLTKARYISHNLYKLLSSATETC